LPGIKAEDVEVSVEDSTLSISGAREFSDEVKQEHYHRIERRYGSFSRAIALPPQADTTQVDARFADGILTVEVPKVEKAVSRTIEIKGAK
jgi:HSP20 family protein